MNQPQQPGPYGGQPDPYGQQGPYGPPQTGGYGQPAPGQEPAQPFPGQPGQPGQYGQPGQPGQPGQYGQPDPYGQAPGQPGQPDPYGQQPGTPGYLPPGYVQMDFQTPQRKSRTGLIIGLVVALVVVGAGFGAYFLFFHKSDQQEASDVVSGFGQAYTSLAHSMSAGDLSKVKQYLCTKDQQAVQSIYDKEKQSGGADTSFSITTSNTVVNGSAGTFSLVIKDKGEAGQTHKGTLLKQNNQWVVCDTLGG